MKKSNKTLNTNRISHFIRILCFLALAVAVICVGINVYIVAYSTPYIYNIEDVPKDGFEAALALGAKVTPSGTLSLSLRDRVDYAVLLYKNGLADKLLLSGDHGRADYDEVNAMMNHAETFDIPAKDIFLDHAGFSTYDSMLRAKEVFQCRHIIIVTQSFHLYRAVYIARKNGIDAIGVRADQTNFAAHIVIKNRVREFLARVKAFIEVEILKPAPKYLGDSIPITGDGTVTHDK
jgi:SanA protein